MNQNNRNWTEKISNLHQVGGIETSVLDNGMARGTRIAWVNTGSGLRFKVVIDRAMDIADAFYNEYSLAWLSHGGISYPQPFSDSGTNWLRTFGGGLLTTCGLTHVGGPEEDSYGRRGLHDAISNLPSELIEVTQPDPDMGEMEMSLTGIIKQTQALGPNLELKRKISAILGKPIIKLQDVVTNRGNTPSPLMLLYHFNFGWPLVDEGTKIIWEGEWEAREQKSDQQIFKRDNSFKTCPGPLEEHNGRGEEACFIDVTPYSLEQCLCGLSNEKLGLRLLLKFKKDQLPWLTNWQHWGRKEYVTGLEPGTNRPTGQARAREKNELYFLPPGASRIFDLEIEIEKDTLGIAGK